MRYLTVGDVVKMHEREVGEDMLADFGLLESAVSLPQQTWGGKDLYPDIAAKSAILFYSIIRNHPFIDGNKRAATMALESLLLLNGFKLTLDDVEVVALAEDVAKGLYDVERLIGQLKNAIESLVPPDFGFEDDEEDT